MIRQVRRYGQVCPLARALDVVGERWSMLIVRELTVGPRRYGDLLAGLPGIPTNLLANRLRELRDAGLIRKGALPRPAANVAVYELTEAGRALRPAIAALREWGSVYGSHVQDDDDLRPSWALLSASDRPTSIPDGRVCELKVGDEVFYLEAHRSRLTVHTTPKTADTTITMHADDLYRLMSGEPHEIPLIRGDSETGRAVIDALRGALVNAG
jgi:DNA-binding HxlR family transcriptional regulator